jgi:hypothetical protein
MKKNLLSNTHFQYRLVGKLKGRKIITKKELADIKEGSKDDHTSDLKSTDRSALQVARNYCSRSDKRKGLTSGQFLGVVVTKYTDASPGKMLYATIPNNRIGGRRPPRKPGTTTWLYYIEPQSCEVFYVDTTPSGEHLIGKPL